MPRIDWADLPADVHAAIIGHTGPVVAVDPVPAGRNSDVAAVVHTATGTVFTKGNRDGRHTRTQRLEAQINPHVTTVAPRLLWQVDAAGWNVLGFEHVAGRPADLTPGSPDLPKIAEALGQLACTPVPVVPLRRIEDRWAEYADPAALRELAGATLLHTDLHPDNILITDTAARFVDWAWPTLGAAWIDTACLALWLITAGHSVYQAEAWAAQTPAWVRATPGGIDTFTTATAALWRQIADTDPQPWKRQLATAAHAWAMHRTG